MEAEAIVFPKKHHREADSLWRAWACECAEYRQKAFDSFGIRSDKHYAAAAQGLDRIRERISSAKGAYTQHVLDHAKTIRGDAAKVLSIATR